MFGSGDSEYWQHDPGRKERLPGIASMARTLSVDEAGAAIVLAKHDRRLVLALVSST